MENRWENFAKQDPLHYIDTSGSKATEFFEKGETYAARILDETAPYRQGTGIAIEIGPGVGRIAIPIARKFQVVRVVDVSPTMLGHVQENCRKAGITNVETYLPHETWDEGAADLIYSSQVFRHIEDYAIIEDYLRRSGRCLSPSGCANLMFETRPASILYKLRGMVPDLLLPRDWRKGIQGYRRTPELIKKTLAEAGLQVRAEKAPVSRRHIFIVTKSAKGATQ